MKEDGIALQFASAEMKNDKYFILNVLKVNAEAIKYIDKNLKADLGFILNAVRSNRDVLMHLSSKMKNRVENRLEEEAIVDRYQMQFSFNDTGSSLNLNTNAVGRQ